MLQMCYMFVDVLIKFSYFNSGWFNTKNSVFFQENVRQYVQPSYEAFRKLNAWLPMNIIFYLFSEKCSDDENIPLSWWQYTTLPTKPYCQRDETRVFSRWKYGSFGWKLPYLAPKTMAFTVSMYGGFTLYLTFKNFL